MTRNKRRKQPSRNPIPGKKPDGISVNLASFLLILMTVGLCLWSLRLISDVFMPGYIIILSVVAGGILGTIVFFVVWKKEGLPILIVIIYGLLVGCPVSLFAVVGGNYYLRSHVSFDITTDILRTGINNSKNGNCNSVYALATYDKIEHEVEFPCSYAEEIKRYKHVRLQLSKGLFGYYVLLHHELVD